MTPNDSFKPTPHSGGFTQALAPMKTLEDVLGKVNRADIAFGKEINSATTELSFGETALHVVAIWGNAEAIEVLVSNGANIDKAGENGFTPLHYAVEQNMPDAVKTLLRLGAKSLTNHDGRTPGELARLLGNKEIDQILAAHGF